MRETMRAAVVDAPGGPGEPGPSLLIRGGTSSVGLAPAVLAARRGMTVYATTRREVATDLLTSRPPRHGGRARGRKRSGGAVIYPLELVHAQHIADATGRGADEETAEDTDEEGTS